MNIAKTNISKKKILIWSIILVVLIGIVGYFCVVYFSQSQTRDDTSPSYTQPSTEEVQGEDTTEQNAEEQPGVDASGGDTEEDYELTITSVNQQGSTLQIRTMISPLAQNGECKLALGKVGEAPITNTTGIQSLSSYSTCQGFNIDASTMTKGSWSIEVTYQEGGASSTARGTVVVK